MSHSSNLTEFEELYANMQRKVSTEWHRRLDRLVSGSQATILWMLELQGPQKVSALAERLDITPGAVTSLSGKLISSGYANRMRDSDDRRVVYLEITAKGQEMLYKFRVEIKNVIGEFFAGLSDEDMTHLIRIYKQVLKNLDELKEEDL